MSNDVRVYDLGEVRLDDPKTAPLPRSKEVPRGPRSAAAPSRPPARNGLVERADRAGPALTGSLSLFLPGAGQLLAGEPARGLFFATGIGFTLVALHALVTTLDRLFPTLDLLQMPRAAVGAALGALALVAVALHVAAVVHAYSLHADRQETSVHPFVAALASALVPGWGQVLVGHRVRAALLLASLWAISIAWLVVTPSGLEILQNLGLHVPRSVLDGFGPIILVTAPTVVWALAVYDAGVGAVALRRG